MEYNMTIMNAKEMIGQNIMDVLGDNDFRVNGRDIIMESGEFKGYTFRLDRDPFADEYQDDPDGIIMGVITPVKEEKQKPIKVRSNLGGSVNNYFSTVKNISVEVLPATEIISIESELKNIFMDTGRSVSSTSKNWLPKATRKFKTDYYGMRDLCQLPKKGGNTGTTGNYACIAGVAAYLYFNNINEFDDFTGFSVNHMDLSGNYCTRGFSNNRLYNLELCSLSENKIHDRVIHKLHDEVYPGYWFGVSALDHDLIDHIRFNDDIEDIRRYCDSIADTCEFDGHGTIYLGQAGLNLRRWKQAWKDIKTEQQQKMKMFK